MNYNTLHKKILAWYDSEKRDLPWRKSKDPYRIWISEIMLQQTRVETVLPYYERFLSNYPTVRDLAEADLDQLLNLWAGLGYYSRARNLKAAAEQVVKDHGGKLPESFLDLRSLKGIGPYTAAAIASIAYDLPHAAIDGNLERVFSRLMNLKKDPKAAGRLEVAALGEGLVQLGRAGDINQSFMDLSASICLPKNPRCLLCPISSFCEARKEGTQNQVPVRKAKVAPIELQATGVILVSKGELLLARRPQGEWLAGMWDLPWWIQEEKPNHIWTKELGEEIGHCTVKRTITKHKIEYSVHAFEKSKKPSAEALRKIPAPASEYKWVKFDDLHGINLPRPSEKALEKALHKIISPVVEEQT